MKVVIECDTCGEQFDTPLEALEHEMPDANPDSECGDSYGVAQI